MCACACACACACEPRSPPRAARRTPGCTLSPALLTRRHCLRRGHRITAACFAAVHRLRLAAMYVRRSVTVCRWGLLFARAGKGRGLTVLSAPIHTYNKTMFLALQTLGKYPAPLFERLAARWGSGTLLSGSALHGAACYACGRSKGTQGDEAHVHGSLTFEGISCDRCLPCQCSTQRVLMPALDANETDRRYCAVA